VSPAPQRHTGRATGRYKPAKDRHPDRKPISSGTPGKFPRSNQHSRGVQQIEVSPSRLEAAKALFIIEKEAKVSEALEKARTLKPEDMALMRELVYGVTRQKRILDYHLNNLCSSPFVKLPVEVKVTLRMGLYQLLFLDRVPARAAVHESVNLTKIADQEALSGFVNAVLRAAETKKSTFLVQGDSEWDTLALEYSHPTWLVKKWGKNLEKEQLVKVLKADNHPHPVFLHVKPGTAEKVIEDLKKQAINVSAVGWPSQALRMDSHEGGLFAGESFLRGDWVVQDWVPQAMMELLPLSNGQKVWDVCAAPGGKTAGLAWKVGEKGQVLASDASKDRQAILKGNLKRLGMKQVLIHEGAIDKLSPAQKFDLVWVDAPCSGTGVLSRRADLRWKLIPKEIEDQVSRQQNLLAQSSGHLYSKGYLVYSTCSLEDEENAKVISDFLAHHPEFQPVRMQPPEGYPEMIASDHGLTFWPTDSHDGGFLAVLRRE
jgi:16S rRNA (cytosine967-C5)-methyltransferase